MHHPQESEINSLSLVKLGAQLNFIIGKAQVCVDSFRVFPFSFIYVRYSVQHKTLKPLESSVKLPPIHWVHEIAVALKYTACGVTYDQDIQLQVFKLSSLMVVKLD